MSKEQAMDFVVICENKDIMGFEIPDVLWQKIRPGEAMDSYCFRRLIQYSDGRFEVVVAVDISKYCRVDIKPRDFVEDPTNWPVKNITVDAQTVFNIRVWFDATVTERSHRAYQEQVSLAMQAAGLDTQSIADEREVCLREHGLDPAGVAEKRLEVLREHRLDDDAVAQAIVQLLVDCNLDDASIDNRRTAELQKLGLV